MIVVLSPDRLRRLGIHGTLDAAEQAIRAGVYLPGALVFQSGRERPVRKVATPGYLPRPSARGLGLEDES